MYGGIEHISLVAMDLPNRLGICVRVLMFCVSMRMMPRYLFSASDIRREIRESAGNFAGGPFANQVLDL